MVIGGGDVKRRLPVEVGVGEGWFWASTRAWRFVPIIPDVRTGYKAAR